MGLAQITPTLGTTISLEFTADCGYEVYHRYGPIYMGHVSIA